MSAAGARFLGSLFSDAMNPKVAAPVAAGGSLFAADDSEAMPSAVFKAGVQHPYAQLRKLVARNKQNGISPEKTVTDWIHKNTNYEHIGKVGRDTEGMSGDWYKGQIDAIYDMVLDGIEPNAVDKDLLEGLDAWRGVRADRDSSHVMPHVAAAAAATGAGAASAEETPDMGWREWPAQDQPIPTSPAERGFAPWSEYEPERVIDTSADMMLGNPLGAMGNMSPITGGEWANLFGMPMAGLQGMARGLFGLATGEDVVTAGAEAANMMGADYSTPYGYDTDEGWRRYGQLTEDTFRKAGTPEPISKGLGVFNQYAPQFIFPF